MLGVDSLQGIPGFASGQYGTFNVPSGGVLHMIIAHSSAPVGLVGGAIASITNPNAGAVTITTTTAHGLTTGNYVSLSGITGQTSLNSGNPANIGIIFIAQWQVTVTSATAFTLNGALGNGVGSGGGTTNVAQANFTIFGTSPVLVVTGANYMQIFFYHSMVVSSSQNFGTMAFLNTDHYYVHWIKPGNAL